MRMRTRMWLPVGLICGLLVPAGSALAQEKEDLAEVQGQWEVTRGTLRVVKEHKGNKTILHRFNSKGEVVSAHASEFKLERVDGKRVFTAHNAKVIAGPDKGKDGPGYKYTYKVEGDLLIEVSLGAALPEILVWKRPRVAGGQAQATPRFQIAAWGTALPTNLAGRPAHHRGCYIIDIVTGEAWHAFDDGPPKKIWDKVR